ncbi:MAG TPA: hypothetical protein VFL88_04840 [Gemmatimonadales bacterium]|nr:hypothetical protein [Gemmatimonadales bacterium]
MASPIRGVLLSVVLGAVAGFGGLLGWLRLLRHSPELQEALAVTPEGVPDTAAALLDKVEANLTQPPK